MKRVLILVAGLLVFPLPAFAAPIFHLVTESDPGGANNLILSGFDSLTDFKNFNNPDTSPLQSLTGAVSVAGLTYDGNQYHLITESDPGGANNLILSSFNTLTDLKNFNNPDTSPLQSLTGAVSVAGLTFDGNQYHLLTESDPGGANNLILSSFDSLIDLKNFDNPDTSPLQSLTGAVSAAGLAYDGSQYHLMTESDPGGANNLILSSFDTLTDLKNFNNPDTSPLQSLTGAVSAAGLMFDGNQDVTQVPEPETLLLFGFGLAGMLFARRRTLTQSPNYAVRSSS